MMAIALDFKRSNALAYIDSDPTDIAFLPRERVPDGSGGFTWTAPASLAPQRFRLITNGNNVVARRTVDGQTLTPDLLIMGPWNSTVHEGWTFLVDGRKFEVIFNMPDIKHCSLSEVIRRG